MSQDQFCLTFGKENWNTLNIDKHNEIRKVNNTPVKTIMKKAHYESISKTARTTSQKTYKSTPKKVHFFKQSELLYEDFYEKPQRKHSMTNAKEISHRRVIEHPSFKQNIFYEPLNYSNRVKANFEDSPHVSFKQNLIRTENKTNNHSQKYQDHNIKPIKQTKIYSNPLDKDEIIKTSKKNDNLSQYQQKLFQYKEDMNRLDSLINRINQRITSSNIKFGY